MTSEIEKDRQIILEQLNNLGRRLERTNPDRARELNAQLRKLAEWLATSKDPRGPKGGK
jgi:hypothetical protein